MYAIPKASCNFNFLPVRQADCNSITIPTLLLLMLRVWFGVLNTLVYYVLYIAVCLCPSVTDQATLREKNKSKESKVKKKSCSFLLLFLVTLMDILETQKPKIDLLYRLCCPIFFFFFCLIPQNLGSVGFLPLISCSLQQPHTTLYDFQLVKAGVHSGPREQQSVQIDFANGPKKRKKSKIMLQGIRAVRLLPF